MEHHPAKVVHLKYELRWVKKNLTRTCVACTEALKKKATFLQENDVELGMFEEPAHHCGVTYCIGQCCVAGKFLEVLVL